MQSFSKKIAAFTAVAALGASGLVFAAENQVQRHVHRNGALMQILTESQKAQAKTVFQEARQSAQPIRQQLRETRKDMRQAVQTGNTAKIQQLSTTEGNEMGQLMAIRSSAFSKVYQTLSPEQKAKFAELQKTRREAWKARRHEGVTKSAS
ncbi:MAG TPA: Spy/CpxP family protein refolding chaperone [Bryobacteraceae bacterium]|nr:Spy/CpxP family protein refolding chaperone [Bryobacteraceae bacterium]